MQKRLGASMRKQLGASMQMLGASMQKRLGAFKRMLGASMWKRLGASMRMLGASMQMLGASVGVASFPELPSGPQPRSLAPPIEINIQERIGSLRRLDHHSAKYIIL